MRHYEILANGCIPYFADIDYCPEMTLTQFPKEACLKIKKTMKMDNISDLYDENKEYFENYTKNHLTTKALAKYVLETIK